VDILPRIAEKDTCDRAIPLALKGCTRTLGRLSSGASANNRRTQKARKPSGFKDFTPGLKPRPPKEQDSLQGLLSGEG
jgi:hypothetical protein